MTPCPCAGTNWAWKPASFIRSRAMMWVIDHRATPPMLRLPGSALAAARKSLRVLYGLSFFTARISGVYWKSPDGQELLGLVAHVLHDGLRHDGGRVGADDGVAVGLGPDELRPAHGPAAADLVVDDDLLAEHLLEQRLLEPGRPVGLTARIPDDQVGDGLGGVSVGLPAAALPGDRQGEDAQHHERPRSRAWSAWPCPSTRRRPAPQTTAPSPSRRRRRRVGRFRDPIVRRAQDVAECGRVSRRKGVGRAGG